MKKETKDKVRLKKLLHVFDDIFIFIIVAFYFSFFVYSLDLQMPFNKRRMWI